MQFSWSARVFGVAAAALALSACGSAATSGSPGGVITVGATNYAVQPTTASTLPPSTDPTATGGVVATEQTYTVAAGDYLYGIAKKYNVQATDIATYNGWADGVKHPLSPGDTVKIPPGASAPGAAVTTTTSATGETNPPGTTGKTTTTVAGGQCAPGSYTIAEGDYPGKVAKNFNVTVDALNAANANTKGYSAFYKGLKIVIPPKSSC